MVVKYMKKRYLVITPLYDNADSYVEARNVARAYYGDKDYEPLSIVGDRIETVKNVVNEPGTGECNADMLISGLTLIFMSQVSSVYFSKDWEQDDYCKFCQLMAFKHGLDIVYEHESI